MHLVHTITRFESGSLKFRNEFDPTLLFWVDEIWLNSSWNCSIVFIIQKILEPDTDTIFPTVSYAMNALANASKTPVLLLWASHMQNAYLLPFQRMQNERVCLKKREMQRLIKYIKHIRNTQKKKNKKFHPILLVMILLCRFRCLLRQPL